MKNKIIIFISLIVVIVVMGVVLVFLKTDEPQTIFTEDEVKFKEEYESLNGIEYKEDHLLKTISIVNDNNIKYVSDDEIISLLENGTNIIYLGWPECNWCRSVVPVLIDVAKFNEIDNVYYYNFKNVRVAYENDNDVNKSKIYEKIVSVMGEDLISIFEEESPRSGEKKVLAPTVIFIKNGEYVGSHTKTVDSHIKDTDDLTEEQIIELNSIYQKYIDLISMDLCYQEGC